MEPREVVAALERMPRLVEGSEERFRGYGVLGLPFGHGDILALRRFGASSIGPAYTAVWHRDPAGGWTFFADVEPDLACARYFGGGDARAVMDTIAVNWTGPRHLVVSVRDAGLVWSMDLAATPSTRLLNAFTDRVPEWCWRDRRSLHLMGTIIGAALGAGRVRLGGGTPRGQRFRLTPRTLWRVVTTHAAVRGRDLGPADGEGRQASLGDFWIPSKGIFATADLHLALGG